MHSDTLTQIENVSLSLACEISDLILGPKMMLKIFTAVVLSVGTCTLAFNISNLIFDIKSG